MSIEGNAVNPCAPEERNVYGRAPSHLTATSPKGQLATYIIARIWCVLKSEMRKGGFKWLSYLKQPSDVRDLM